MGEVFDGRLDYVKSYIGPLPSVLNYPLYFAIKQVFAQFNDFNSLK